MVPNPGGRRTPEKDSSTEIDTQTGAALKVKWDDSSLKTTCANVCNVASTREEVTLLSGTNPPALHRDSRFVASEPSQRMPLSRAGHSDSRPRSGVVRGRGFPLGALLQ